MEPPASYMAPVAAATPPGYQGEASHSAPYGMYSRNNFSNFVGLRPLRSESSNSVSEKQPGTCQESSEALSSGFGTSAFHQQQSAFVSKLLDHSGTEDTVPYPPQQDLNQYPFGSAYDKYMTQLSSCSTDTRPHIFSTRYVDSSEMAKATVPVMNDTFGESSFSFSSYMNPIRINLDYFDCVWNEQKNHGYQTTDKQHGKWDSSDDVATVGNYPLNPLGDNHLGSDCLGYGRPMHETSERKQDLGSFNSKLSSSEVGFVQPREFSSELLEVNNTTVDSPCWKGTPATYQPSFGIMENDAPHTVIGTVSYSSSRQSQKAPELSSEYPGTFPEYQEASCPQNDPLKLFKLPVRCNDSSDHKEVPLTDVRVHTNMTAHASYLPDKQHEGTQNYDSGENPKNVITSSQQESSCPASKPKLLGEHSGSNTEGENEITSKKVLSPVGITGRVDVENLTSGSPHKNSSSPVADNKECTQKRGEEPSQCYPGVEGNMLNMSCDSGSSTRAIFLKLMHDLSVVLLSTCKGGSSLQQDEEGLLQAVIQNLTAASSKRSKVEQKVDDVLSKPRQMKFKTVDCGRNIFGIEMHKHSPQEHADSEFKTTVSQVLPNHPEDKIFDDSEVSHASVYKNLWIESEASACKLKYELQLARMKLATLKDNNNTLKVPDTSGGSKGSNSSISTNKPEDNGKGNIDRVAALLCHGGDIDGRQFPPIVNRSIFNGVDADVFARFKVLQSRVDNISSFCGTEREGQQEASKKSYVVEDDVMARLKVLNSRPDNIASSSQESIKMNGANDVDDDVIARLRILESRPRTVTFFSKESSEWQPDESTNRDNVDDAIMARLRILESRPNNVSFWGQESSKQPDASRKREDRVDDDVMARLKILKSRPDNINSMGDASKEHDEACSDQLNPNTERFTEQCTKFRNSDDLADFLERNNSVSALDLALKACVRETDKAGGSADVGTPNKREATADDVMMKGAVQGEDNLEECHVPCQTAGDALCVEGSHEVQPISSPVHQYGSSPPEWEHVLKENFFHPGK